MLGWCMSKYVWCEDRGKLSSNLPHVMKVIQVAGLTRPWTPSLPESERETERERESTQGGDTPSPNKS